MLKWSLKNKTLLLVSLFFILIFGVFIFTNINNQRENSEVINLVSQGQDLIKNGNYKDAKIAYQKILQKQPTNTEIQSQLRLIIKLEKSSDAFNNAKEQLQNKKYEDALLSLSQVIPEDKENYNQAQDKIKGLSSVIISSVKELYNQKNYSKANELAQNLLSLNISSPEIITLSQKCQAAIENQEKAKIASALNKLRKQYDEVEEITWYYDKSTPKYIDVNNIYLYIGQKDEVNPWLRFVINYADDSWLFISKYIIKTDDQTYVIEPSYDEIKRDNGSGSIWEWYDAPFGPTEKDITQAIITSKKTIIRCEGDDRVKDRIVSDKEKTAMKNILNAYEALGGPSI